MGNAKNGEVSTEVQVGCFYGLRWAPFRPGGSSVHSAEAAVNLGILLEEEGDKDGARVAYQLAIDSGYHEYAPMAAFKLGLLLEEEGVLVLPTS